LQTAGFGFLPVVHETTGALGREAHDSLLAPLLLRMQEDDEAKQQVRATLESLELPWNARSVRSYFLRKVGVCIARVVGSQLATAKWRGRRELGLRKVAQEAADAARRRPSGLAGTQRATLPAPQQPSRAMSLA